MGGCDAGCGRAGLRVVQLRRSGGPGSRGSSITGERRAFRPRCWTGGRIYPGSGAGAAAYMPAREKRSATLRPRLHLKHRDSGRRNRIAVAQRARVEAGTGRSRFPSERRANGQRAHEHVAFSLRPTSRRVTARWSQSRPVGGGYIIFPVFHRRTLGHARSSDDLGAGVAWRLVWSTVILALAASTAGARRVPHRRSRSPYIRIRSPAKATASGFPPATCPGSRISRAPIRKTVPCATAPVQSMPASI